MVKYYSVILSSLAFLVSACALFISYLQYNSSFIEPELNWKISDYRIDKSGKNSYRISSNITFSVTNKSTKSLYLSGCKFENERAHNGRGAWELKWTDCPVFEENRNSGDGIEVKAGQTRFFDDVYELEISDPLLADKGHFGNPELAKALTRMGLIIDEEFQYLFPKGKESCSMTFKLRPESASFGGSCGIERGSTLFRLLVLTGDGRTIGSEVRLTFYHKWPWDTLGR